MCLYPNNVQSEISLNVENNIVASQDHTILPVDFQSMIHMSRFRSFCKFPSPLTKFIVSLQNNELYLNEVSFCFTHLLTNYIQILSLKTRELEF